MFIQLQLCLAEPVKGKAEPESENRLTFPLMLYTPVAKSIDKFSFHFWVNMPEVLKTKWKLVVRKAEWEVRDATQRRQIARLPAEMELGNYDFIDDKRTSPSGGTRYGFNPDDLRRMGDVPPGEYVMALLINDARASNVVSFRIDPNYDETKEPALRLTMVEAPPTFVLAKDVSPRVDSPGWLVAYITGPTPEDPEFNGMSMIYPEMVMDGSVLKDNGMRIIMGPVAGPYKSGQSSMMSYYLPYRFKNLDLTKPHDFQIRVAGGKYSSAVAKLDLSSQTLGEQWDKATATITVPASSKPMLAGIVRDTKGKPAIGWVVSLRDEKSQKSFTETTDEKGQYTFTQMPAGEYTLGCSQASIGTPCIGSLDEKKVTLKQGETLSLDLSFECKYMFAGKVKDAKGNGLAGVTLNATWCDPEKGLECITMATTKKDGTYKLEGPFHTVTYAGISDSGHKHGDVKHNVKPGARDVDFVRR
ncbi:MAG: carboxypeptidase regulatory-like domain-containing protein [Candidatus Methylacidiphilales bacterium]